MKTDYDSMRKKAKKILPLVVVAVLAVSLGCTVAVVAAEDFGCACHSEESKNFETSLHHTGAGMKGEYELGAAGAFDINMTEYYEEWNCANCHTDTCVDCHGADPHKEDLSTNMSTCDKCHFLKETSIIKGELPGHAGSKKPIVGPETDHPADVHYVAGLTCMDCHTAEEMHGTGVKYTTMLQAVNTSCEDCHNSPGKIVETTSKNISVTQYSNDIPSHRLHDNLDCTACHAGWSPECINCHLDTRAGWGVKIDDFHLAIGADGDIKPFFEQVTEYNKTIDNVSEAMTPHTAYGAWMSHTVTSEAKNCSACHRSPEALCEGCEGQILGEGGSFIPQEIIDWVLAIPQGIIDRISKP